MQQLKAGSSEVSVARTSCDVHQKDPRGKGVFLAHFGFKGAAGSHFACDTLQFLATCSFLYWGLDIYTLDIACVLFFLGTLDAPRNPVFQLILVACSPSSTSSAFATNLSFPGAASVIWYLSQRDLTGWHQGGKAALPEGSVWWMPEFSNAKRPLELQF